MTTDAIHRSEQRIKRLTDTIFFSQDGDSIRWLEQELATERATLRELQNEQVRSVSTG